LKDKYLLESNEGEIIEDQPAMVVQIKVKVVATGKMEWKRGRIFRNRAGDVQITTLKVFFSCFCTFVCLSTFNINCVISDHQNSHVHT
jgi:hypothetical protein